MTSIFPEQHSDTRIFVLSALGSVLLHGIIMAGLTYWPKPPIVAEKPPTVQVTLLPTPETPQASQKPTPPVQPQAVMPTTPTPPMPTTRKKRVEPPAPPRQAALTPPRSVKPTPLTPPKPAQPILRDTQASQALKAREMMKMRVPSRASQAAPSLPLVSRRRDPVNEVVPPLTTVRKERSTTPSLPAPPRLVKPHTLTATPPAQTGPALTSPTIISSSRPIYPRMARESGWEGTVIVRTLIDTNGVPSQVLIRKSCGHPTLDQAAQDAVKSWIFQPAKDGNIPISKWVDIPIKFDLNS